MKSSGIDAAAPGHTAAPAHYRDGAVFRAAHVVAWQDVIKLRLGLPLATAGNRKSPDDKAVEIVIDSNLSMEVERDEHGVPLPWSGAVTVATEAEGVEMTLDPRGRAGASLRAASLALCALERRHSKVHKA